MERGKRILVTALDWGLGHAARCIPIIQQLQDSGCEVLVASNGNALALLKKEFPYSRFFELPGYNPIYPLGSNMIWKMGIQLPKFICAIRHEHIITNQIVYENKIDVVISDNRYGCYSLKAKSIFITHQATILMPEYWGALQFWVNRVNTQRIKNFDECWVPDIAGSQSIAGKMAINSALNVRYIGILSRLQKMAVPVKYDIMVIASGPEPQKSLFIDLVSDEWRKIDEGTKIIWVLGNALAKEKVIKEFETIKLFSYLTSEEMNKYITESNIVISRSGYSTVMDLAKLGKKAIFIPTPGQTEQLYLAQRLMENKTAYYMPQSAFNLEKALKESDKFSGFTNFEQDESLLKSAIQSIL